VAIAAPGGNNDATTRSSEQVRASKEAVAP
jgi:hypothetical protein